VGRICQGTRPELPPLQDLPGADRSFTRLPDYVALMQRCWAQNPADRPTFQVVVKELRWEWEANDEDAAVLCCAV
jgi:hypothetical protein